MGCVCLVYIRVDSRCGRSKVCNGVQEYAKVWRCDIGFMVVQRCIVDVFMSMCVYVCICVCMCVCVYMCVVCVCNL